MFVVVFAVLGTLMFVGVGLVAGGWMALAGTDPAKSRDSPRPSRSLWGRIAWLFAWAPLIAVACLRPVMERPSAYVFVFPILLCLLGVLATASSAGELSDPSARRALLMRQVGRYLYRALILFTVLWLENHDRTDLMVGCIVIAFVPDVVFWLVKRRMAPGLRRGRVLGILDRFVIVQEQPQGAVV